MQRILHAFTSLHARPEWAQRVAAPPYDGVERQEARRIAGREPMSFLRVTRPEADMDDEIGPEDPAAYAAAAANLARLEAAGAFVARQGPALYACRIRSPGHEQVGLLAAASVEAWVSGAIVRHEHTRPGKVADRARHIETLGVQGEPVLLACPDRSGLADAMEEAVAGPPALSATDPDGATHELWTIGRPGPTGPLADALRRIDRLYIADGHHRAEAASAVFDSRAARGQPVAESDRFLAYVVPQSALRVFGYNRLVRDLGGQDAERLGRRLAGRFEIAVRPEAEPDAPGVFAMYAGGAWTVLRPRPGVVPTGDPVAAMDASVLQNEILSPLLGIDDPRTDERLAFAPGTLGVAELRRRVDSGAFAAAFALHPARVADVIAVAEAGGVVPPKSTWFAPKVRSGLVLHRLW